MNQFTIQSSSEKLDLSRANHLDVSLVNKVLIAWSNYFCNCSCLFLVVTLLLVLDGFGVLFLPLIFTVYLRLKLLNAA